MFLIDEPDVAWNTKTSQISSGRAGVGLNQGCVPASIRNALQSSRKDLLRQLHSWTPLGTGEKERERAKLKHSHAENTSFVNETWSTNRKPPLGQDLAEKQEGSLDE